MYENIKELIAIYRKALWDALHILYIRHIVFCPSVSTLFVQNDPMILISDLARMI